MDPWKRQTRINEVTKELFGRRLEAEAICLALRLGIETEAEADN